MFLYDIVTDQGTLQILSNDNEDAAFAALQLAQERGFTLLDVRPIDETNA